MLGSSAADALLAYVNAEQVRAEQAVAVGQVQYVERFGAVNNRLGRCPSLSPCESRTMPIEMADTFPLLATQPTLT